jgi:hypothetical protein
MATKKVEGTPPVGPIDIGGYAPGAVGKFDKFVPKKKDEPKPKKKTEPSGPPDLSGVNWEDVGKLMTANGIPIPGAEVDWETAAKEQYGGYYSLIEGSTELRELLKNAVEGKWSDSKFTYELQQTTWYKTTSASTRTWDANKALDPATTQQQIDKIGRAHV